jgi:hypothetical protein
MSKFFKNTWVKCISVLLILSIVLGGTLAILNDVLYVSPEERTGRAIKKIYGEDFVDYLKYNYSPLDIVFRLASETSLVVLNGGGFDGPEWSIRVSLANLNEEDYVTIGKSIRNMLDSYAQKWKDSLPVEVQP